MTANTLRDDEAFLPEGRRMRLAKRAFFFAMLLPCVLPAEVSSTLLAAAFLLWLAASRFAIERAYLALVAPLLLLLLVGALGAAGHEAYDVGKDIWYMAKPLWAIGIGYVLMAHIRDHRDVCRIVVAVAVLAALLHLLLLALYHQAGMTLYDVRVEDGVRGYFVVVIGLALMLAGGGMREYLGFNERAYHLVAVLICAASVFASMSRTELIALLLMIAVLRGWMRFSAGRAVLLLVLAVAAGSMLLRATQAVDQEEMPYVAKLLNSVNELSIEKYEDDSDINTNWRGYESFLALADYAGGSGFEWLCGKGLGTLVDLGFYIDLGGNELRYIPMLHNGYVYILLKYGALGILIYLYFIVRLIRSGREQRGNAIAGGQFAERLLSALGWLFLFTTLVIAGILNKYEMESAMVLLGATAAWVKRQRSTAKENVHVN